MKRDLIFLEITLINNLLLRASNGSKKLVCEATMRINIRIVLLLFAIGVILSIPASSQGRYSLLQEPTPNAAQGPVNQDPITRLNLTPEQRQKIRAIREQTKNERAAINQRLRESNVALQQALDADNPDDAIIEERLRDVAVAQAAATRMRVLTEVRIRRVLTPEQVITLRSLRQQAAEAKRELKLDNRRNGQRVEGGRPLPDQRNGMTPMFPARGNTPRNPRP
jgi:Spy/CpxP family protein refolding chaperone